MKRQVPPSWNFHVCRWVYLEAKNLQFLAFQHFNFNGPASLEDEDTHPGPPTIFNEASLNAAQENLEEILGAVKAVWSLSRFSNIYPKICKGQTGWSQHPEWWLMAILLEILNGTYIEFFTTYMKNSSGSEVASFRVTPWM